MSSIILAGGHSSRLGQDKCSLVLAGEELLQRLIVCLSQLGGEIILVLAQGQGKRFLSYPRNVKIAADLHPGKGPLAGIYSGLKLSRDPHSVVVACDMPFLNIKLLRYMRGLAPGFDVVIPRVGDLLEPLHAVYSRSCLGVMKRMLGDSNFKVSNLLKMVKVRYVEESEIASFDPGHLSLFNINTPADLQRAQQIVKEIWRDSIEIDRDTINLNVSPSISANLKD
ncbi:MAG: putative molybdenum cofactor guanylyltransferase [Dehalococcoidia bacterium]|nr:putative molybdenum cofactor guanylyltransferase [Chloroflexota bacterium]MBT9161578.1 putative molybdenum cofactor guanylyltransferase [Chloroflexota bacterium]